MVCSQARVSLRRQAPPGKTYLTDMKNNHEATCGLSNEHAAPYSAVLGSSWQVAKIDDKLVKTNFNS